MNLTVRPALGVQLGTMLNFAHASPSMYGRALRAVQNDVFATGGTATIADVHSSTTDAAVLAQFKRSVIVRARPHLDRATRESAKVLRRTESARAAGFINAQELGNLVRESLQNDIISRGPALSMARSGLEVFRDSIFEGMLGEFGVAQAAGSPNSLPSKGDIGWEIENPYKDDRKPHILRSIEAKLLVGATGLGFLPSLIAGSLNKFYIGGEGISFLSQLGDGGFYVGCVGTGLALAIMGIKHTMRIGF